MHMRSYDCENFMDFLYVNYYFILQNMFVPGNEYKSIINSEKPLFVCLLVCD
jgi:hypothetical protein